MMYKSLSTRSKGSFPKFAHHRGLSLVELMMSIVLIAIGAALALPSFSDQVQKRQITQGAEQLASFINSAQGEAIKSNSEVWVSWNLDASNDWCIGANSDSSCDCTQTDACQVNGQSFVIDNTSASNRELIHSISGGGDDNAYSFDPVRGLMSDLDDALEFELRSNNEEFRLNLQVNNAGRVLLCSDSATHAIPGYQVCQQGALQFVEAGL